MDEYEKTLNFKFEDEPEYGSQQFNCTSYEDRLKQISNTKFKAEYYQSEDKFDDYIKQFEAQQEQLNQELGASVDYEETETDPYLASAIEFMYYEDTEEDFNTMDRKQ